MKLNPKSISLIAAVILLISLIIMFIPVSINLKNVDKRLVEIVENTRNAEGEMYLDGGSYGVVIKDDDEVEKTIWIDYSKNHEYYQLMYGDEKSDYILINKDTKRYIVKLLNNKSRNYNSSLIQISLTKNPRYFFSFIFRKLNEEIEFRENK